MKEKIGAVIFGIGIMLLSISMTFILIVLSTSPIDSRASITAACYLLVLIGLLVFGSYLHRSNGDVIKSVIEYLVLGAIFYLLTCLLLDGGRLQRATNYAFLPYFILATIICLRWRNLTWLDIFLLRWAWLPIIVILTPIFYRVFEDPLRK